MKRKIALLTLAAVMGISVTACGGPAIPADERTDNAADSKTEATQMTQQNRCSIRRSGK